jgi:hypothetical protein
MLDAIIYVGFSAFETFCVLYIILAIARLQIKDYLKEMIFGIIVISVSSYLFKEVGVLNNITPMLNLILILLILVFVFKISLKHSMIVVVIGYIIALIIQGIILYTPIVLSSVTFKEIKGNDITRYTFQTISAITIFLIGLQLKRKNIGFVFVPYAPSLKFKLTKNNLNILYLLGATLIITGSILEIGKMYIGIFLLIVLFNFALFMGLRRERGDIKFD